MVNLPYTLNQLLIKVVLILIFLNIQMVKNIIIYDQNARKMDSQIAQGKSVVQFGMTMLSIEKAILMNLDMQFMKTAMIHLVKLQNDYSILQVLFQILLDSVKVRQKKLKLLLRLPDVYLLIHIKTVITINLVIVFAQLLVEQST